MRGLVREMHMPTRISSWIALVILTAVGWAWSARAGDLDPVLDALKWEPHNRRWAAQEMGRRGDRAATDTLMSLLHDENEFVREDAAWALSKIKDPPCRQLSSPPNLRGRATAYRLRR